MKFGMHIHAQRLGGIVVVVDDENPAVRETIDGVRVGEVWLRWHDDLRQAHDELAAHVGTIAACLDVSAVHRHQAPHQREADAKTALCPAVRSIDLSEHIEHGSQPGRGNADPVVAHRDLDRPVDARRAHRDVPARVRVLRRVVQQVGEHLFQSNLVAGHA